MAGERLPGVDPLIGGRRGTGAHPDVEVQVWWVLLQTQPALLAGARALLSGDERRRADAFYFPHLRDEFTVARATLRLLLSRLTGNPPGTIEFAYGPQGKPSLAGDGAAGVEFNVSHSGGILGCAFTRHLAIGVDVEQHRPLADLAQIAQHFFSPAEVRDLMRVAEPARAAAFYDCWSRKEAFIKALGGGLSIPLDCFRVSLAPECAALLEVRDAPGEARAWTIQALRPAPGFSGALAIRHPSARVTVRHVGATDIFAAEGLG
ncbi:MAG: 4'-phosphopantetheinyl transferase superfamily protein [Vicinamibacterales bacterium]